MLDALRETALVAATVTTGLLAGLFYAFSMSVMPGLGRSDDRTLVEAMQRINVAIINPWLFLVFLGGPLLSLAAAALLATGDVRAPLWWTAGGLALGIATLAITVGGNIPLNNALAATGPPDRTTDLAGARRSFETGWVRWNTARTVTSTAGFVCLTVALLLHGTAE